MSVRHILIPLSIYILSYDTIWVGVALGMGAVINSRKAIVRRPVLLSTSWFVDLDVKVCCCRFKQTALSLPLCSWGDQSLCMVGGHCGCSEKQQSTKIDGDQNTRQHQNVCSCSLNIGKNCLNTRAVR